MLRATLSKRPTLADERRLGWAVGDVARAKIAKARLGRIGIFDLSDGGVAVRDRDAVPDLVQDTFCVALEELNRAHDDVEGWLIQLAAKVCTRHA